MGGAVDSGPSAARAVVWVLVNLKAAAEGHSAPPGSRVMGTLLESLLLPGQPWLTAAPLLGPGTGRGLVCLPCWGFAFCLKATAWHMATQGQGSEQVWLERGLLCYRPALLKVALLTALREGARPRDPQPIRNQDECSWGSFR